MSFLWRASVAAFIGVSLFLSPRAESADDETVYRWVDDQGSVHFTQGRENVPAPQRAKAVPLGSAAGQPLPGATQSQPERGAGPAPPPPPPAPPATSRQPPPPTAPERVALDELLGKAETTDQYLVIGEAYLRLGLPLAAKTCASKAAAVAKTSPEWARVADAYAAIGDAPASSEARKKSEQVRQQERALQNPPR